MMNSIIEMNPILVLFAIIGLVDLIECGISAIIKKIKKSAKRMSA